MNGDECNGHNRVTVKMNKLMNYILYKIVSFILIKDKLSG
jgi:hypothetical protein